MQNHDLGPKRGPFKHLFTLDMNKVLGAVVFSSVVVVAASFMLSGTAAADQVSQTPDTVKTFDLSARESDENDVTVEVEPVDLRLGEPVRFSVSLNTHSGSLDFDMIEISVLENDQGIAVVATEWDGSPAGGHHRSGTLTFPALGTETQTIKLILKGISDVPERVFEWSLR